MTQGKEKSKQLRKVYVRTPGGKLKIHFKKNFKKKQLCTKCKRPLHGISNLIESKFRDLPKTKKRPSRPYNGVLCASCLKEKIIGEIITK